MASALYSTRHKRPRFSIDGKYQDGTAFSSTLCDETVLKKPNTSSKVVDFSDPFAIQKMLDQLDCGRFGSVTKDIEAVLALKMQTLHPYFKKYPTLVNKYFDMDKSRADEASNLAYRRTTQLAHDNVIDLEDDCARSDASTAIITIDSDEEDREDHTPSYRFLNVVLNQPSGELFMKAIEVRDLQNRRDVEDANLQGKTDAKSKTDRGGYLGVLDEGDHDSSTEDDGLENIWNEMSMALEVSKDVATDPSSDEQEKEYEENCDHSFVLKDDLGYVCRICGVIDKEIEKIFEFQYLKMKRSSRTYLPDSWNSKDRESNGIGGLNLSDDDLIFNEVYAHPRHMKQMKPHQVEGFNFLISNLVGDNPGGCILAHAPGSGKTFMIISFVQSFLAKYPNARPLVVLPKGILSTWKKEFQIWQIEDIPLFDFYTVKADNRYQQVEVLKQWVENKSILFLGYKQFSSIVCDLENSEVSTSCREILLKAPSILILDEGHTPRNENTDVLQSLAKVQTPRKVVLSGTLYQNHVKEVFNVLNLVRPKFLRMETSRPIVKRIMSKVDISGVRKHFKAGADAAFFEIVEDTLQKDTDFKRKVSVIHDLREMTSKVLHYYKGDFLDELPGLVDFTVVLNLSNKQKREVGKIKKLSRKFKASSVGSAVYLHPKLQSFSDNWTATDEKMDELLETLDLEDGVKAKFFLNMLNLCESKKEKLLVFSQYLVPLKFLERLAVRAKGWCPGREIFVISGESTSEHREWSMERFNNSSSAKVFFGSIKACGEGISLVGASRIIILDVHLNPSVTRQAIGRAFRPGQKKRVVTYRLVAADSPEEEDHHTCFKKELISRMWFEWNEYCGYRDFEVQTVDVNKCDDEFLESSSALAENVKLLYKR
ncbi:SNF2 domain-containing protein / helicase domain-containing protein [Parasponia andersonii]|uniref:SNF2 domain-containing protein / helicase domain-containing protein n=1 Tax=Parasponia andersonii TaxID=3476 RepID=A0A2P5E5G4_PARAD|nr:SNF2 domain-containing protein / helicase domain-containing protein [Parasponia andersonii]